MKISQVNTKRSFDHSFYYEIVYEWEDVFSEVFEIPLFHEKSCIYNRYFKRLPFVPQLVQTEKPSFVFDMWPLLLHGVNNKGNMIPCIIDFYVLPDELKWFYRYYSKNPLVLVSSKQAVSYLDEHYAYKHIRYVHLALSLPDKYRITKESKFPKKYDLILTGRNNDPVLMSFLKEYETKHPDFLYAYSDRNNNFLITTNKGEILGSSNSREEYFRFMQMSKSAFYITHRIDQPDYPFHQVTPRFLEYLSCGCHIIPRYIDNPDTDYYQLSAFSPSIETYEQFESAMDFARANEVDMGYYSDYLAKHYTSVRAKQLKKLLENV